MYRWVDKLTSKIVYIGQSVNLRRRQREHIRDGVYTIGTHYFEWQSVQGAFDPAHLKNYEREKISEHRPILNRRAGGGGPNARIRMHSLQNRHAILHGQWSALLATVVIGGIGTILASWAQRHFQDRHLPDVEEASGLTPLSSGAGGRDRKLRGTPLGAGAEEQAENMPGQPPPAALR